MEQLPSFISGVLAILLFSSFVKILTTLSILRFGLGLYGASLGLITAALALALSLLIIEPQVEKAGGIEAILDGRSLRNADQIERNFRPFLEKHAHAEVVQKLGDLAVRLSAQNVNERSKEEQKSAEPEEAAAETVPGPSGPDQVLGIVNKPSIAVLGASFLVSELKEAFQLGVLLLIPFVVIDLVVANALLVLGVTQMSHVVVALPLKVLLFFAVDGWTLISTKLISEYI